MAVIPPDVANIDESKAPLGPAHVIQTPHVFVEENNTTLHPNCKVYCASWVPKAPVRGVIVLVHGLGEHCLRYKHVIDKLLEQGFSVYSHDHPGHGRTEGQPRTYFNSFDTDIVGLSIKHFNMVVAGLPSPKPPVFLYGHSMGGATVVLMLRKMDETLVKGAILTAAYMKSAPINWTSTKVFISNYIWPSLALLHLDPTTLSHYKSVQKAYAEDPYNGINTCSRSAIETNTAGQKIFDTANETTTPFIALHGSNDQLASPDGSQNLYDKAASKDKTLQIFPEKKHELHNELGWEEFVHIIIEWINKHL